MVPWKLAALTVLAPIFNIGAAQAQGATVQAVFERYNLLGVFGWDCSKPPSKQNPYFVHRPNGPDFVQRDMMDGPSTVGWVAMINQAASLKPDEIMVSGTRDGKPFTSTYRVEGDRVLLLDSMFDGKIVATGGRWSNGGQIPWAHRCSGL